MIMANSHKTVILQLHNLLVIFIFVFGIMSSWDTSTILVEAIKEDVRRRKLGTDNNPGFISIDCGVNDDYFNDEIGIYYKSDKDFIDTGENHNVKPEYGSNKSWTMYDTLRSFPQGERNCYMLKPKQGQKKYYVIRASFLYGNYDGKNETPVFDLYVGADRWTTVQLPSKSSELFYEIVYFFPAETVNLCLVKTGSGIPFISALELRPSNCPFDDGHGTNHVALNRWAYDLGLSRIGFSRYRDDVYDRIWLSQKFSGSVAIHTSLNISTEANNSLPVEVLQTAIKPTSTSSLNCNHTTDSSGGQYYLLFHFAEIEEDALGPREFSISLNGFKSEPITLEYLKAYSYSTQNLIIQGDEISVTLDATDDSDLPPILNAMEVYKVLQFSFSATDQSDVDAILVIKQTYNISKDDWQGDPCLPEGYTWSGLGCSFSSTPRIISLNLSASKLMGEISSLFFHLKAMQSLDLSNNELSGQVPEFLAQLPNLKVLNLLGNKLAGPIPQSLRDKFNLSLFNASSNKNPDLCIKDLCHREEKKKKNFSVPVFLAIGASVLILAFLSTLIVFLIIRRRQRGLLIKSRKNGSFKSKNRPFTYSQIVGITDNFTTVIGEGGFGKVYLGTLVDNTSVAVKLLSPSSNQGYKEFQVEAQLLMIVHHRNLVSLIGYCDQRGNIALIYEYMANGNLRQHLSAETNQNVLNWKERLQIAIDAAYGPIPKPLRMMLFSVFDLQILLKQMLIDDLLARVAGLEYLHNGCTPPIVHRDLKSANILLTETLQAKIADFGLSKIFMTENVSHISTCPAGTPGYLDPEYQAFGKLNKKSDVYSFGIILFELITGQPAMIRSLEGRIHILEWVSQIVKKGDIRSIIDPRLQDKFNVNAAWKVVEIALSCAQPSSMQRPDMGLVLTELKECMAIEMALGRTKTASGNSLELSLLNMEPDTVPAAR